LAQISKKTDWIFVKILLEMHLWTKKKKVLIKFGKASGYVLAEVRDLRVLLFQECSQHHISQI